MSDDGLIFSGMLDLKSGHALACLRRYEATTMVVLPGRVHLSTAGHVQQELSTKGAIIQERTDGFTVQFTSTRKKTITARTATDADKVCAGGTIRKFLVVHFNNMYDVTYT